MHPSDGGLASENLCNHTVWSSLRSQVSFHKMLALPCVLFGGLSSDWGLVLRLGRILLFGALLLRTYAMIRHGARFARKSFFDNLLVLPRVLFGGLSSDWWPCLEIGRNPSVWVLASEKLRHDTARSSLRSQAFFKTAFWLCFVLCSGLVF